MANEEFDISEWNSKRALGELEEGFSVDPGLAHKIWEVINNKLGEGTPTFIRFEDQFPTASGFANFLNEKIK